MSRTRRINALPQLVDALTADSRVLYLFFVDLCGSTQYKQFCKTQGQPDINWILRQNFFLQRSAELVRKQFGGTIVKTIGDELFAFFEDNNNPELILKCAIEIIQSFENVRAYQGNSKLEAKVSIDYGETYNGSLVDTVPYDPIGSAVDRCARLNSISQNNQITFSEEFLGLLKRKNSMAKLRQRYGIRTQEQELRGFGNTKYHSISAA